MDFLASAIWTAVGLVIGFHSEVYLVVWTSLKVSAVATLTASIIGVPLGLLIAVKRFWGKQAVLLVLNTSMAVPTVVVGLFFYAFLSRRGPLGGLGLLFTPAGISMGLVALSLPLVVNLSLTAIQGLDTRLFLTCKLLGANPAQQAWLILKEARFSVMAAVVMAFGRVISELGIAMMLGGNIRGFTRTMTTAIALETSKGEFEFGLALGIVLLVVALAVNVLLFVLQEGKR
ncbi:MAG: ABC transporter permease [Desulfomonile sp.]|nr:ABC transporter permease [Deltaproteobacteria bacterium]